MAVPHVINELIERFHRNEDEYRSGAYNETQLRRDFIDPFFEALGWDVNNRLGYAEAYRHVVHEDAIKIGGHTKAPDYGFYIGETRKFFVEAKNPSVNVKHDVAAAFQLRRYGWSAKLQLSILTNFDEFAVYDCRSLKPVNTDRAATARLMYLGYQEYAERWDEIASIFSRDAVLKGAFDKYAEQAKGRRGTVEVDDAFLAEIESWRKALAGNIYKNNPHLNTHELNFAVGSTIDRIIFLRICEDRGIEPEERLKRLIEGRNVYEQLLGIFYRADQKYNSGLFHFEQEKGRAESPDTLTPGLTIDDKVLRDIFKNIYLPLSPYEFSVLPADILGQIYEQFLGKVIEVKANRAEVHDKPEVRKAGGVYYTPTYIVDYIVKNTVGKLCDGKTPKQVERLRILDPACGSGSFLIGAYQYLLDWYLEQYTEDGPEKHLKRLRQDSRGLWRLTTAERKRILLQNIYGVDIDTQAVEVTKLSLLLKVLEGESEESLSRQMRLLHERVLPDLGSNIKWGNSLVESDFYDDVEMNQLSDEEHYSINAFDWSKEFPDIIKAGGFDAVVGNPPYGIIFDESIKDYLEQRYETFVRNNDMYVAFTQKAIELLKPGGDFGFIIPNTFLIGPYFDDLKRYILSQAIVRKVVDFGLNQVFPKPNVFTSLLFLERTTQLKKASISQPLFAMVSDISTFPDHVNYQIVDLTRLESLNWSVVDDLATRLLNSELQLDNLAWVKDVGLNYWTQGRGKTRGGSIADRVLYEGEQQDSSDMPYLKGRDIVRYAITFSNRWLRHDYQRRLDAQVDTFRYSPEFLEQEKILYRQTADRIIATIETHSMLIDKTLHCIVLRNDWKGKIDLRYLLGLLNSRLLTYLYRDLAREEGRTFAQVKTFRVKQLPIHVTDLSNPFDKAHHNQMIEMVERMLAMHRQLAEARTEQERTLIQRRIDATDAQIDRLVYELYGLTEEEIKVVEEATR